MSEDFKTKLDANTVAELEKIKETGKELKVAAPDQKDNGGKHAEPLSPMSVPNKAAPKTTGPAVGG